MAVTYTPTTNFGAKDSLPQNDPDKVIKGSEFSTEFTAIQTAFSLAAPSASPTFTGTVTIASVDINGGNIDGTVIGAATPAAGSFTTGQFGTSLNVDGTVTADGLTVDGSSTVDAITYTANSSFPATGVSLNSNGFSYEMAGTQGKIFRSANNTKALMQITNDGDISFYEDTGTTPKFFWDASAEALGLGTTSPIYALDVSTTASSIGGRITTNTSGSYLSFLDNGGLNGYVRVGAVDNNLVMLAGNAERMRIDSSGNVGIGETSPSTYGKLVVAGSTPFAVVRSSDVTTAGFSMLVNSGSNGVGSIATDSGGHMTFDTGSTGAGQAERMRIDSSGNLLVGTASGDFGSRITALSTTSYLFESRRTGTGSEGQMVFVNGNGAVGSIFTNGSATAYNTSSDYRLKNVDGPITNSGAYIDALKPVQGSWKADGSRFIGLIAHEVQEVSETPIATGEKDGEEMQGMDYSAPELIANLIAEIQSLRARVAQLEGA